MGNHQSAIPNVVFPLEKLPDELLLQVFRYFPMEEQAKFGRVNRHFRRISQTAISRVKTLDLTKVQFRRLSPYSLRSILRLCSNKVERMRVYFEREDLASTLAQFSCPNLVDLAVSGLVKNRTFGQLMRNNSNLKALEFYGTCGWEPQIFPDDVINENLETLKIGDCAERTLASMVGRCPNVRTLEVNLSTISDDVLEEFFASCPNINEIIMRMISINFDSLQSSTSFWLLPLRSLTIHCTGTDDVVSTSGFITIVGQSFQHLEIFESYFIDVDSYGIVALSALPNIRKIVIIGKLSNDVNVGMSSLIQCKSLQHVEISTRIESTTLTTLVNGCHALRTLKIRGIIDVNDIQMAAEIAQSFNGFGTNLTIVVRCAKTAKIWKSAAVLHILDNLKEAWGRVITFK